MTTKSGRIAERVAVFRGRNLDPHYLAYFDCFNCQLFYEAHDVLEQLWLADRRGPDGNFYKGLIQFAGAFVHSQKNRSGPACALLKLAQANLEKYPAQHHELNITKVLDMIANWLFRLETAPKNVARLIEESPPRLTLLNLKTPEH
jgi:uncharacterized protein